MQIRGPLQLRARRYGAADAHRLSARRPRPAPAECAPAERVASARSRGTPMGPLRGRTTSSPRRAGPGGGYGGRGGGGAYGGPGAYGGRGDPWGQQGDFSSGQVRDASARRLYRAAGNAEGLGRAAGPADPTPRPKSCPRAVGPGRQAHCQPYWAASGASSTLLGRDAMRLLRIRRSGLRNVPGTLPEAIFRTRAKGTRVFAISYPASAAVRRWELGRRRLGRWRRLR